MAATNKKTTVQAKKKLQRFPYSRIGTALPLASPDRPVVSPLLSNPTPVPTKEKARHGGSRLLVI
jgi:hypothetical protein